MHWHRELARFAAAGSRPLPREADPPSRIQADSKKASSSQKRASQLLLVIGHFPLGHECNTHDKGPSDRAKHMRPPLFARAPVSTVLSAMTIQPGRDTRRSSNEPVLAWPREVKTRRETNCGNSNQCKRILASYRLPMIQSCGVYCILHPWVRVWKVDPITWYSHAEAYSIISIPGKVVPPILARIVLGFDGYLDRRPTWIAASRPHSSS